MEAFDTSLLLTLFKGRVIIALLGKLSPNQTVSSFNSVLLSTCSQTQKISFNDHDCNGERIWTIKQIIQMAHNMVKNSNF